MSLSPVAYRACALPLLFLIVLSCNNNESSIVSPSVTRSTRIALDTFLIEPTEIDLHITASDSGGLCHVTVCRDTTVIFSNRINGIDTIIADVGLLPSRSYHYTAFRTADGTHSRIDASKPIMATTMNTSSHNFTWSIDTIGEGHGSYVTDVSILNDTTAIAVGGFYRKDSLGQWEPDLYNVARWDGKKWKWERVYLPDGRYLDAPGFSSIYAKNANDIWVGAGTPTHWNGFEWYRFPSAGVSTNKIWGTGYSNVYIVGSNGGISHFDGTSWQKQESGTTLDLVDVWGSPDGNVVWACGSKSNKLITCLLKNEHSTGWKVAYFGSLSTMELRADSLSGLYASVYTFDARRLFLVSTAGIYATLTTTHGEARRLSYPLSYFDYSPNSRVNSKCCVNRSSGDPYLSCI